MTMNTSFVGTDLGESTSIKNKYTTDYGKEKFVQYETNIDAEKIESPIISTGDLETFEEEKTSERKENSTVEQKYREQDNGILVRLDGKKILIENWENFSIRLSEHLKKNIIWVKLYPNSEVFREKENASQKIGESFRKYFKPDENIKDLIDNILEEVDV